MARHPKRKDRPGVDRYGRAPLHAAAFEGDAATVRGLLAAGANPNAQDDGGWTPLHAAAQACSADVTALLLQSGANPNLKDEHGNGPLSTSLMNSGRDTTVFQMLIGAGANPREKNRHGQSVADTIAIMDEADAFAAICRAASAARDEDA